MKTQLFSLLALAATAGLVAAQPDQAKKDPDPVVIAPAPVTTPTNIAPVAPATVTTTVASNTADPFANIAAALDNTTKATTSTLAAPQESLAKTLDAQISATKASGVTNGAMAEEKLALARADFAQKLRDLSLQGDETWKNAKAAAQISLQNLRRVYAEYRAGQEKN